MQPPLLRTILSLLPLALLTTASPQSTINIPGIGAVPAGATELPQCATPALILVLTTSGCQATDTACLCSKPDLQSFLNNAVKGVCSNANDQQVVAQYAAGFCTTSSSSELATATSSGAGAVGTGGKNGTANGTTTTASYSSPLPTSSPSPTGAAMRPEVGLGSMGALAAAIGAMTWIFAEF